MLKKQIIDLFSYLVSFDTQSNEESTSYPSTENQVDFAEILAQKCIDIGLSNVRIDKNGYVMAEIPSNIEKEVPVIGFISHMDTSPDCSGKNVKTNIIEKYDGKDIILKNNITISPEEFPNLKNYINQTIITSDGTTLLGADDKAGITEILLAMDFIIKNKNIKHGKICIAFTPDEEIGKGVDFFDVKNFGADFAYTVDGGEAGEFNFENFNAARVVINIKGKSVHPGSAKGIMINASEIASNIIQMFPKSETPSTTDKYEGFYHLVSMKGNVEKASLNYIIRDFEKASFQRRKHFINKIVEKLNHELNGNFISIDIHDEYYNMLEILDNNKYVIELASNSIKELGIDLKIIPIRGGTDGARLSFMGLPCPNIFTGGHNFHGPYEYISVDSMEKTINVIIKIIEKTDTI